MQILDACCGSKMFWYDKDNSLTTYMDNREIDTTLCDGRKLVIKPDIIADFTNVPFDDGTFDLVVFDPPHLINAGANSWLAQKYGVLPKDWQDYLRKGFSECFRALRTHGILIFKWNTAQIPFNDVVKLAPEPPLFGDRRSDTRWTVFCKGAREQEECKAHLREDRQKLMGKEWKE